tara:strand:- start:3 stop:638 length:636 start_codon:yes stop_codon:yes gene_type:complete
MIYFIVTTCILNKDVRPQKPSRRKKQYINGIKRIIEIKKEFENSKIIIVENNGERDTFLNKLTKSEIYYTNNNIEIDSMNKGIKEIKDIHDCIKKYNIKDNDFIVKITGRYVIAEESEFFKKLKNIENIDCIIRYGYHTDEPSMKRIDSCTTGLIGMRCKYVKKVEAPEEKGTVEEKWAKISHLIDDKRIIKLDKLGIYITPNAVNNYYLI